MTQCHVSLILYTEQVADAMRKLVLDRIVDTTSDVDQDEEVYAATSLGDTAKHVDRRLTSLMHAQTHDPPAPDVESLV